MRTTHARLGRRLSTMLLAGATLGPRTSAPQRAAIAVSGVVFDSLGARPLAEADVQLVRIAGEGTTAAPGARAFFAKSDARGQFHIDSVEPGTYLAGFFHPVLDSLGLQATPRRVTVAAGSRVDLALPSAATLVRTLCARESVSDTTALLLGWVRDARTREPRPGASVRITWGELVVSKGGIGRDLKGIQVHASPVGWYALCGVPAAVEVALSAGSENDSSGVVFTRLAGRRVIAHDLYVGAFEPAPPASGDSLAGGPLRRGHARVAGRVRAIDGRPIANAQIAVRGATATATADDAGEFTLADVPAGSQTVDVRAIGFLPARATVHVMDGDGTTTEVALEMTSLRTYLDTIRVTTTRIYDRDSNGFEKRRRDGVGHFMTRADIERRVTAETSQLLAPLPGVVIMSARSGNVIRMRTHDGGYCRPDIILDGMRIPNEPPNVIETMPLDFLVTPDGIDRMEVYARDTEVPSEFKSFSGCGAIVIWTRRVDPLPPKEEKR